MNFFESKISLTVWACRLSFFPIPVMAAIESQIATELGAPAKDIWFIPAWTLSITVCFMIA